jgi:hypothetical protein
MLWKLQNKVEIKEIKGRIKGKSSHAHEWILWLTVKKTTQTDLQIQYNPYKNKSHVALLQNLINWP